MVNVLSNDRQIGRRYRPKQVLVRFDEDTFSYIEKLAYEKDMTVATLVRVLTVGALNADVGQ